MEENNGGTLTMLFHKKKKGSGGTTGGDKTGEAQESALGGKKRTVRSGAGKVSGLSADLFHEQRPSDKNPMQFL